ncbi:MAG: diacylglycerol kinase family lipid kinase [Clostridia bacterium]|nr:diacylglycerol kinase family lipid kinase [Clostridia bacterium]
MKALFIVNPNAGLRVFQNIAYDVARHLLQSGDLDVCQFLYTKKGGDAFEATAGLKPGEWDFVLAAGGDGTVNEVVNGLMTSDCGIPLLVLPAGTTNDFATALGIGRSSLALEKLVKSFCVKDVDVGVCNGRYFLNSASGGVISNIAHNIPPEQKAQFGILAYYSAGLKEFGDGNFTTSRLRITTKEETFEEDVFLLVIANSFQAGGFQNLAPAAKLDDGLMDVFVVRNVGPFDVIPLVSMIQTGQHVKDEKHFKCIKTDGMHVELLGDGLFSLDCDGESLGKMPMDFKVSEKKLKLLVPANSPKTKKLFSSKPAGRKPVK